MGVGTNQFFPRTGHRKVGRAFGYEVQTRFFECYSETAVDPPQVSIEVKEGEVQP